MAYIFPSLHQFVGLLSQCQSLLATLCLLGQHIKAKTSQLWLHLQIATKAVNQHTVNSQCKDTQHKDVLTVRTKKLRMNYCMFTAMVLLSTDKWCEDNFCGNQCSYYKEKLMYFSYLELMPYNTRMLGMRCLCLHIVFSSNHTSLIWILNDLHIARSVLVLCVPPFQGGTCLRCLRLNFSDSYSQTLACHAKHSEFCADVSSVLGGTCLLKTLETRLQMLCTVDEATWCRCILLSQLHLQVYSSLTWCTSSLQDKIFIASTDQDLDVWTAACTKETKAALQNLSPGFCTALQERISTAKEEPGSMMPSKLWAT